MAVAAAQAEVGTDGQTLLSPIVVNGKAFVPSLGPTLGMMRRASLGEAFADASLSPISLKSPSAAPRTCTPMSFHTSTSDTVNSSSGFADEKDRDTPPRFDVLTIRQWFNLIDTDGNGHLDKQEWLDFLRDNVKLKRLILRGSGCELPAMDKDEIFQQGRQDAREIRRLLKIWREIDSDGSGTLEWEEFVDFFRRSGHLLEYRHESPKQRLAEIFGSLTEAGAMNDGRLREFDALAGKHLPGDRRRYLQQETQRRIHLDSLDSEAETGFARRQNTSLPGSRSSPRRSARLARGASGLGGEMDATRII